MQLWQRAWDFSGRFQICATGDLTPSLVLQTPPERKEGAVTSRETCCRDFP